MDQDKNYTWIWIIITLLIILGLFFIFRSRGTTETTENENATSSAPISSLAIRPYGEVTLKLGETANFNGISITPLSITEDSRCATGVQCIQAGTVRVNVRSLLNSGVTRENVIGLGSAMTVDTFSLTLTGVTPYPVTGSEIALADYRLKIRVNQSTVVDEELIGK